MAALKKYFNNQYLLHGLFWLMALSFTMVAHQTTGEKINSKFLLHLLLTYGFIATVVYCNLRLLMPLAEKNKIALYIVLVVLLLLVVSFVESIVFPSLFVHLINNVLFVVVTSLLHIYRNTLRKNQQLKELKAKAEIHLLKEQVNPHFFFNTLNSLYHSSITEPEKLPNMIVKMGEMMRYMFENAMKEKVPLEQEIAYINNYVLFEKMRFADRIQVTQNIQSGSLGKEIAPMLLMPFIENAFKYGSENQLGKVVIDIAIAVQANTLFCIVENEKSPQQNNSITSNGTGIANTQKRLQLLYPLAHSLQINDEPERFKVSLTIQL